MQISSLQTTTVVLAENGYHIAVYRVGFFYVIPPLHIYQLAPPTTHTCMYVYTHFLHLILPQACDAWLITSILQQVLCLLFKSCACSKPGMWESWKSLLLPSSGQAQAHFVPSLLLRGEQLIPLQPSGSSECRMLTRTKICMEITLITYGVFIESQQGEREREREFQLHFSNLLFWLCRICLLLRPTSQFSASTCCNGQK